MSRNRPALQPKKSNVIRRAAAAPDVADDDLHQQFIEGICAALHGEAGAFFLLEGSHANLSVKKAGNPRLARFSHVE